MSEIKLLNHGYIRLVDTLGDELAVVNTAHVSYDKESTEFTQRDSSLWKILWREDHTSPFRHAALTFEVYAPLFVARQWWKYAVASTHIDDQNGWNESSRRYITEEEQFYIPAPNEWRSKPENSKQGSGAPIGDDLGQAYTDELRDVAIKGLALYREALEDNIAPEIARLFLPAYGMFVRWRWTVSLQGVLTFLEQRLGHDAQVEIQLYAQALEKLTANAYPNTFAALKGK